MLSAGFNDFESFQSKNAPVRCRRTETGSRKRQPWSHACRARFIRQMPRVDAKQGAAANQNPDHPTKFEEHPHWFHFTLYDEPPACPPQAEGLRKSSGTLARQLLSKSTVGGVQAMLAGAIVAVLLIFG